MIKWLPNYNIQRHLLYNVHSGVSIILLAVVTEQ